MKEIKTILKKHKFTCFVVTVFSLTVIVSSILAKIIFSNRGNLLYGDRLQEIESVKIYKDNFLKTVDKKLESIDFIADYKVNLKIRTFNFVITVKDNVSVEQAKTIPLKIMELVEEKYKNVYSFDFFIVKKNIKDYKFPLEATQQYGSGMSWIRD